MATKQELPSDLHLGCGDDYREGYHNVDYVASVDPDETVDLNATPWPWPNESFETIVAEHVFEHLTSVESALRECNRILKPNGTLITKWPMGINARADPDHSHEWTWQTPEFYCGKRHWDIDVGLTVVDRGITVHSLDPRGLFRRVKDRYWKWKIDRYGPGEWCFSLPGMSGEFTVVFEK